MKKFLIEHIDPLGQGVYKENDQVFFIPKTLPGESGSFNILNSSKGVHFGELISLDQAAAERQKPDCPYFNVCNGCAYLHTSYEKELEYKVKHFQRLLSRLESKTTSIQIINNEERFHYRNRIQLHYNKNLKILGFKKRKSNRIQSIDNCLLADSQIQQEMKKLTHNNSWLKLIPKKERSIGHVEISTSNSSTKLFWNRNYAANGFSQVNPDVNKLLKAQIKEKFQASDLKILDLFGGNGNLVSELSTNEVLSVDIYKNVQEPSKFFNLDLYSEGALATFQTKVLEQGRSFDTLFIDPPRSGFKQLTEWVETTSPKSILYVSCNPSTMIRDIEALQEKYKINASYLIDFFPGTYHFEAAIELSLK